VTLAQEQAIQMLREDSRRDIYEGGTPDGKSGSGEFFVTYSNGQGPRLSRAEVAELVNARLIMKKWPGFYALAPKEPKP